MKILVEPFLVFQGKRLKKPKKTQNHFIPVRFGAKAAVLCPLWDRMSLWLLKLHCAPLGTLIIHLILQWYFL